MTPLTANDLAEQHGNAVAHQLINTLLISNGRQEACRIISDALVEAIGVETHLLRSAANGFALALADVLTDVLTTGQANPPKIGEVNHHE